MTREQLLKFAQQSGFGGQARITNFKRLEMFASLVAQKTAEEFKPLFDSMRAASDGMAQTAGKIAAFEREECARLCEELDGYQYARAIRARSEK